MADSPEYQGLVAQAKTNNDLLDSMTNYINGVGDLIIAGAAAATDLATLKTQMTALGQEMKAHDDAAAAALVSKTPAAAPAVTPPGPVPIAPPVA